MQPTDLRRGRLQPPRGPLPQLGAAGLPVGHEVVHERVEPWAVAAFQQMAQLVDHHVFQALRRMQRLIRQPQKSPYR